MSLKTPTPQMPAVPAAPSAAPQLQPANAKPTAKSSQPTFLGGIAANPANTGRKTLLGQ